MLVYEKKTTIDGLYQIIRVSFSDSRGSFQRLFCKEQIKSWPNEEIKQINITTTAKRGTIRGVHFQFPPKAECKMVTCIKGAIFDVAVDLRKSSKRLVNGRY